MKVGFNVVFKQNIHRVIKYLQFLFLYFLKYENLFMIKCVIKKLIIVILS
jgi:hypothetical protein